MTSSRITLAQEPQFKWLHNPDGSSDRLLLHCMARQSFTLLLAEKAKDAPQLSLHWHRKKGKKRPQWVLPHGAFPCSVFLLGARTCICGPTNTHENMNAPQWPWRGGVVSFGTLIVRKGVCSGIELQLFL